MAIDVGSVIQITPDHDWGGCLAIVDELKVYGCRAYVSIPLGGKAYINLNTDDYRYIGEASHVAD